MDTVIRDNLLERDEPAEVFWFNCRVCGVMLPDMLHRGLGLCSDACMDTQRKLDELARVERAVKKRRLAKLSGVPA